MTPARRARRSLEPGAQCGSPFAHRPPYAVFFHDPFQAFFISVRHLRPGLIFMPYPIRGARGLARFVSVPDETFPAYPVRSAAAPGASSLTCWFAALRLRSADCRRSPHHQQGLPSMDILRFVVKRGTYSKLFGAPMPNIYNRKFPKSVAMPMLDTLGAFSDWCLTREGEKLRCIHLCKSGM